MLKQIVVCYFRIQQQSPHQQVLIWEFITRKYFKNTRTY